MYVSKIDMVTGALRSQIQNGEYRPGQPLRQRDVAAALGVSITPVREALRRLESEGLVTYDPHCGATVVEVDFGPTQENFEIRASLEALAASLAARRMTPEEVNDLERVVDKMTADVLSDPAELVELNRQFHFGIIEGARAPLLNSMIRRLWQSFGAGPVAINNVEESVAQHQAIVAAIRAGDPDLAAEATKLHVISGRARSGLIDPPPSP
ncbi:MAG TPA: GntR family transcriptional regulator [Nocardioides sp.]